MAQLVQVLVKAPAHSQIAGSLCYLSEQTLSPGTLVRVPLGQRETTGLVWEEDSGASASQPAAEKLRPIGQAFNMLPPLSRQWLKLVGFAANYYQRSIGELALAALPQQLRELSPAQLLRRLKRQETQHPASQGSVQEKPPVLTTEQSSALAQIEAGLGPFLLFGATGSGKTEVYLQCVERLLEREPQAQALVLVPEINLTPQLESRFSARFGAHKVVSFHSGLTHPQRLKNWLAAHQGSARIVLGTRMAVFTSMPSLRFIVVDEEHDPSYKQQEGARYSARDLAIYRGHIEGAKVILGSATPSLESWYHSRPQQEGGRYQKLFMPSRVGDGGQPPLVRFVDMNHQPKNSVFSPPLLAAIQARVERGEQCLILLNRRGYAPVLHCTDCAWKSECPHCSAFRVFHKVDRSLRCHHCGFTERVPRTCPACGNPDIRPLGRGTEKLEEHLNELLGQVLRPDGTPVCVARIDADTTRHKGTLESQMARMHAGEIDVLVGTQMIAKGHDFRNITLVAAVNVDNALFSSDFRASERLFSLLLQAAGRSGRDAGISKNSEMWVQTFYPSHPLFEALKKHDFPLFAFQLLKERQQASLPPFSFQALVRAEARTQETAQDFLLAAGELGADSALALGVTIYPAVPMSVQRIANIERAQMLIESPSRTALQRFLLGWHTMLHDLRQGPWGKGLVRWAVDVDPLVI